MYITSQAIVNGVLADKYGGKGTQFSSKDVPTLSFPFEIHDAPENTKSFAIIYDDDDAVTACGFTWVHWLVADLKKTIVEENESLTATDFKQGVNSWHSCAGDCTKEEATVYGGPYPPNGEHLYIMKVFALDTELGLDNGFRLNELKKSMDGHVISHAKLKMVYSMK
jgi:Raf kinase inhibitor-like YbhB/YbcL family protein